MAKVLDFNRKKRPTIDLIMQDEDKTVIKVTTPSVDLMEEYMETLPDLQGLLESGGAVDDVYDVAARLMSCNTTGQQVTVSDLRTKYRMDLYDLVSFFTVYTDFINEVASQKN